MKTILFALGALAVVSAGCDSEVTGGGGGSGGGGGADTTVTATSTSTTGDTTGSTSTTTGSTSTTTGSTATGTGGAGGSGGLGVCEEGSGSAVSVGSGTGGPGGSSSCEMSYSCEGGEARVECNDDGVENLCDCYLGDELQGSCDGGDELCSFPLNCCYALLGGVARPNTGPFGACQGNSGAVTSSSGGPSSCSNYYACEGGELSVDCEETEGGGATCECKEGQGFTLGTCEQETVSCEYESSCCYAIFNP